MRVINRAVGLGLLLALGFPGVSAQQATERLDRSVLPIPDQKPPVYTELDVRKAEPPQRFEVKAPAGAPNVVVALVDDLGFAGTSAFGGPVGTPSVLFPI